MKKMNRREFLTLTGAAVVALSLAGCDDEPYAPPAPPAPPAPTTSKETKVLEAIKKYRAAAGAKEPLVLDDGLKPATELVVKITKDGTTFDMEVAEALDKAARDYNVLGRPIGMSISPLGKAIPVCVYPENVDQLVDDLSMLEEDNQTSLKSASLIAIQVFVYNGEEYWVAVAASGKK